MATIGSLVVDLRANTAKLDEQLKQSKSHFHSLQKTIHGVRDALVAFGAVKVLSDVLHVAAANQKAFAILTSQVKATGGAAGYSAEQLSAMAMQMERTTTFSHEQIEGAQSELLAFTNITGERFKKTLQVSADFAAVTGRNLPDAIRTLGEAINNPVQAMGRLTSAGVSLTKQQEAMIKTMASSGDLIGAQNTLLKDLQTSYGGAAEAARNTIGGALEGLKNQFNDLIDGSDGSFNGAIGAINQLTATLQSPQVKEGFATLVSAIAQTVSWAAKAVSAFVQMGQGLGILMAKINGYGGQQNPGLASLDIEIKQIRSDIGGLQEQQAEPFYQTEAGQQYLQKKIDHDKQILKNYLASRKAMLSGIGQDMGIPASGKSHTDAPSPLATVSDPFASIIPPKSSYQKTLSDFDKALGQVDAMQQHLKILTSGSRRTGDRHQVMGASEAMSMLSSITKKSPQYLASVESDIQQMVGQTVNGITVTAKMAEDAIAKLAGHNQQVQDQMSQFAVKAAHNMESSLAKAFDNIGRRGNTLKDDLHGLFRSLESDISNILAKMVLEKAFGGMASSSTSWIAALGSAFGGAHAAGGPIQGNKISLVGEAGPELFMPNTSGTIVPHDAIAGMGGTSHTINIDARGAGPDETAKLLAMRQDLLREMRGQTEYRLQRNAWMAA